MKKIIALVLSLCLLCGAVALAETTKTTEVYYTIEPSEAYTVTIPAELNLTQDEEGRPTEYMVVKIEAPDFNVPGKSIFVRLTAAAFKLVNGSSDMPYAIQINEGTKPALALGDEVASWTFGDESVAKELRVHVTSMENALVAGKYSDQLTFTVSVGVKVKN